MATQEVHDYVEKEHRYAESHTLSTLDHFVLHKWIIGSRNCVIIRMLPYLDFSGIYACFLALENTYSIEMYVSWVV